MNISAGYSIPDLQVMKTLPNAKGRLMRRGTSNSIRFLVLSILPLLYSLANSSLAHQVEGKLHFNCNHIIIFMSFLRVYTLYPLFFILVQIQRTMNSSLASFDRITRRSLIPIEPFPCTSYSEVLGIIFFHLSISLPASLFCMFKVQLGKS